MTNEQTQVARFAGARLNNTTVAGWMRAVLTALSQAETNRASFDQILRSNGLSENETVRKEVLDLVIEFVDESLRSGGLTDDLLVEIRGLKAFLLVREGDFFEYRPVEVSDVLVNQLDKILKDFVIDREEDLFQVELQAAFGLGYDQYFALTRRAFEETLDLWDAQIRQAEAGNQFDLITTLKEKRSALEPFVKLAMAQRRTLGGLY
jgi:hypothetical protein